MSPVTGLPDTIFLTMSAMSAMSVKKLDLLGFFGLLHYQFNSSCEPVSRCYTSNKLELLLTPEFPRHA